MKTTQSLLLASLSALVAADFPAPGTTITFWRDAGCDPNASSNAKQDQLLPSSKDDCISGTASLGWPTSKNNDQIQIAYYTGDGLPASCDLAILEQSDIQPGACGSATTVINGGTTGSCRMGKLPIKGGSALCCGGKGNGCSAVPSAAGKRAANITAPVPHRDVTQVKRSGILDRLSKRDCSFTNSAGTYTSRGQQQIASAQINCPGSSPSACSITEATTRTTGSTNSFGVSDSIKTGEDFFVDIENTISFSYMYSYESSKSVSSSYTIQVPPGQTGYITWTPTVSCVDGSFAGDCDWNTGDGTACIPLYVNGDNNNPQGTYAFLQEQ